jgi:hypothetical protein
VVNCDARVSRVSGEAVDGGVLSMAAWREAVWLVRVCCFDMFLCSMDVVEV